MTGDGAGVGFAGRAQVAPVRARRENNGPAGVLGAAAEIDILDVEKIALVETAKRNEVGAAHDKERAADRADALRRLGQRVGVAVIVPQAQAREACEGHEGAPKREAVAAAAAFGVAILIAEVAAGDGGRERVEHGQQPRDRVALEDHIRIDEGERLGLRFAGGQIAGGGEADIALPAQNADAPVTHRGGIEHGFGGGVIAVIGDDDLIEPLRREQRVEARSQGRPRAITDDDGAGAHARLLAARRARVEAARQSTPGMRDIVMLRSSRARAADPRAQGADRDTERWRHSRRPNSWLA